MITPSSSALPTFLTSSFTVAVTRTQTHRLPYSEPTQTESHSTNRGLSLSSLPCALRLCLASRFSIVPPTPA